MQKTEAVKSLLSYTANDFMALSLKLHQLRNLG